MSELGDELPGEEAAIERAFGAVNRRRILADYFDRAGALTYDNAWQHVYRLLLWINPTISLAHCYESDKCQPHKAWYPRSLAFHAWVSNQLDVPSNELREQIDELFRVAFPALAQVEAETRREAAAKHLEKYAGSDMPVPGDDPDLVEIITDTLGRALNPTAFDAETSRQIVERIYAHFALENKRKNLLGRGFEDTLAAILNRLPGSERWEVRTRVPLAQIPGFMPQSELLKRAEVDLAMWQKMQGGRRVLVSAKWSVRADRERQFESDFDDYTKSNAGSLFDYVLITNEFDAARLDAAARNVRGNTYLFTHVVHVNPTGVLVAYGKEADAPPAAAAGRRRRAARQLRGHIESDRLIPLSSWLERTLQ
jgi:hypothetical protein